MSKIPILFELMDQREITAKKLSIDTGISTGNISDWKSGRSKPSAEKLAILAKYFDVSVDYLLGTEKKATEITDEDVKFALFGGTEGITDEMYEEVKAFAEFVKKRKG